MTDHNHGEGVVYFNTKEITVRLILMEEVLNTIPMHYCMYMTLTFEWV